MFINAPKKAAKPVSSPTISPIPTASSPSVMSHPNRLGAVVEQGLDERAVPVERDGPAAGALGGDRTACSQ